MSDQRGKNKVYDGKLFARALFSSYLRYTEEHKTTAKAKFLKDMDFRPAMRALEETTLAQMKKSDWWNPMQAKYDEIYKESEDVKKDLRIEHFLQLLLRK